MYLCKELTLYQQQIFDSSKLKEFADDIFKFDENGKKLSRWVENSVGKEKSPGPCLGMGWLFTRQ